MLEHEHEPTFSDLMEDFPLTLAIPLQVQLDLRQRGAISTCNDEARVAARFRCRGPAILKWTKSPIGLPLQFPTTQVIVKNLSRTGFSVLADRQWYPEQCVKIYFSSAIATAKVIRAKRLGSRCYDIGFRIATFRNFES